MKGDNERKKQFLDSEYERLKEIAGEKTTSKYINPENEEYNYKAVGNILLGYYMKKFYREKPLLVWTLTAVLMIVLIIYLFDLFLIL